MDMQEFIPIDIFCRQYGIEITGLRITGNFQYQ